MYPNLYYAFKDLFGLELSFLKIFQMFGFFIAVSFLAAGYFFTLELKRKEKEGVLKALLKKITPQKKATPTDYLSSAAIGFLIGYKLFYIIQNFDAFTNNTQEFILSAKGNVIGGFIMAGIMLWMKYREIQKNNTSTPNEASEILVHPYEHVGNMTVIAAVAGIIGAKIFHNLENLDDFAVDPIGALISFSGLTMYGGLILGSIAVLYYANKNKLAILPVMDACAPGLMLAYGTGRIGCHLSGDGDWGINNTSPNPFSFLPDWFWSYQYPHNVLKESLNNPIPGCDGSYCFMLEHPVFPTPLYEAIACILLFGALWLLRKRINVAGILFCVYLVFNGVERFFIEKIRINTTYTIWGNHITQAELISSALVILGVVGIILLNKNAKKLSTP